MITIIAFVMTFITGGFCGVIALFYVVSFIEAREKKANAMAAHPAGGRVGENPFTILDYPAEN